MQEQPLQEQPLQEPSEKPGSSPQALQAEPKHPEEAKGPKKEVSGPHVRALDVHRWGGCTLHQG